MMGMHVHACVVLARTLDCVFNIFTNILVQFSVREPLAAPAETHHAITRLAPNQGWLHRLCHLQGLQQEKALPYIVGLP